MKTTSAVDTARLGVMLNELRLPTIKIVWPQFAEHADKYAASVLILIRRLARLS